MFVSSSNHELNTNRLLSILPVEDRLCLRPYFETVELSHGQVINDGQGEAAYAYYPIDSVISLVSTMQETEAMELAMVGREGFSGVHAALSFEAPWYKGVVKVSGQALRIESAVLRERFKRNTVFSVLLMQYLHALYAQIAQVAICYRRHRVQLRLQTWMTMMFNRVRTDNLKLKQEEIAITLGYTRQTISAATAALQEAKIIRYSRGRIYLLDHTRLEQSTCECYKIMESQYEGVFRANLPERVLTNDFVAENLVDLARSYIEDLSSTISYIREICDKTDSLQKRQKEIINRRLIDIR